MDKRVHLGTLYGLVIAIAPLIFWVDGRYAHADDVIRANTQLMYQTQQNGINIQKSSNQIEIRRLTNKMHQGIKLTPYEEKDFDILHEQKVNLQGQQQELDRLIRQEIN